jgi:hypothetical protein
LSFSLLGAYPLTASADDTGVCTPWSCFVFR